MGFSFDTNEQAALVRRNMCRGHNHGLNHLGGEGLDEHENQTREQSKPNAHHQTHPNVVFVKRTGRVNSIIKMSLNPAKDGAKPAVLG